MALIHSSKEDADKIISEIVSLTRRLHLLTMEASHTAGLIKGEVYGPAVPQPVESRLSEGEK